MQKEFLRKVPVERQNGGMADYLCGEDFFVYQTPDLELRDWRDAMHERYRFALGIV